MKKFVSIIGLSFASISPAFAEEAYDGIDVSYDMLAMPGGYNLEAITTRPAGAEGKLPAIYFVQSLSCGNIEVPGDGEIGAYPSFLKDIATHWPGVFRRVNKAGVGNSDGDCSALDLQDEISDHRAALEDLLNDPGVDPDRLFILGSSAGSATISTIGAGFDVKGYAYSGGFYPSWYQHMAYIHHNLSDFRAADADQAAELFHNRTRFHFYVLYEGLAPSEVVARYPELDGVWEGDETTLYGRPLSYYRQLNNLNLIKAWTSVTVPVLIIYGENDWIMGIEDQEKLASDINQAHPGLATLVVVANMGHSYGLYGSKKDAHFDTNPGGYATQAGYEVLRFFGDLARSEP